VNKKIPMRNESGAYNFGKFICSNRARRESLGADSLIFCSIPVRAHHLRGKFQKLFLPVQMSALRAMSMQNLTHARANISSHGDNNAIPALQNVLISSVFLQSLRHALDNA
jgi:hypothetical protein